MFNRNFFRCAAAICVMSLGLSVASAEVREVEADGEYRLGDNDTRSQAKELALDDAKKAALEKVAVFIESYSIVNDFQMYEQQIMSYTGGKVQIKSKAFDFAEDGLVCKAHITATVDINEDEIKALIDRLKKDNPPVDPYPIPPPPYPVPDPIPDLSGADLTGLDLTGANLEKANLTGARLERTILDKASLRPRLPPRGDLPRRKGREGRGAHGPEKMRQLRPVRRQMRQRRAGAER